MTPVGRNGQEWIKNKTARCKCLVRNRQPFCLSPVQAVRPCPVSNGQNVDIQYAIAPASPPAPPESALNRFQAQQQFGRCQIVGRGNADDRIGIASLSRPDRLRFHDGGRCENRKAHCIKRRDRRHEHRARAAMTTVRAIRTQRQQYGCLVGGWRFRAFIHVIDH